VNDVLDDWILRVRRLFEQVSIEAIVECFWPPSAATRSGARPAEFKAAVIFLVLVEPRNQQ
jgi:hypothetical protein